MTADELDEAVGALGDLSSVGRAHGLALALALVVHLVSATVLLAGVALVVWAWPGVLGVLLGLAMVGVAWNLRPRAGRLEPGLPTLQRDDAPILFGLLDHLALELGAATVATVQFDASFNASYGRVGYQQRPNLVIGLPLWAALEPPERVALLAHELAHDVNGDVSKGLLIQSSIRALADWNDMLAPPRWHLDPLYVQMANSLVLIGMWPVRLLIRFLAVEQRKLLYRGGRRAEYRADLLAARVAGTGASLSLLDHMLAGDGCVFAIERAGRGGAPVDVVAVTRSYLDSLPPREWERLRRRDRRRGAARDSTHPPTFARVDALAARPADPPRVRVDLETAAAIDREVWPHAGAAFAARRRSARRA